MLIVSQNVIVFKQVRLRFGETRLHGGTSIVNLPQETDVMACGYCS